MSIKNKRPLFLILCLPVVIAAQVTLDDIRNMPVNSWLQVPGTNLSALDPCPTHDCAYSGVEGITGIHSYSGAVLDTKRNRLVCFGGGHDAYYGNEVYAFDIDGLKWSRLTDPSASITKFTEKYPDGNPTSRHTYNGLDYIGHADRMFALGGSPAGGGCGTSTTWAFDFTQNKWFDMNPAGTALPAPECQDMAVYDPISKKVYWGESHIAGGTESMGLWSYDYDLNRWTHLNGEGYTPCIGIIDTKRNLLVIVGNPPWINVHAYHLDINGITSATPEKWATTGGDNFIAAGDYKGLQYDPVADKYVGIDGSGTIWILDPGTKEWTSRTPTGTKPYMAWLAGIYGLWRYVPGVNAYIFETYAKGDVSFYKFTAGGGTAVEPGNHGRSLPALLVTPNPVQATATIHPPRPFRNASLALYSITGKQIRSCVAGGDAKIAVSTQGLNSGVYLLKAVIDGKILTQRILIQK